VRGGKFGAHALKCADVCGTQVVWNLSEETAEERQEMMMVMTMIL